jgi:hypothetical protein
MQYLYAMGSRNLVLVVFRSSSNPATAGSGPRSMSPDLSRFHTDPRTGYACLTTERTPVPSTPNSPLYSHTSPLWVQS